MSQSKSFQYVLFNELIEIEKALLDQLDSWIGRN